MTTRFKDFGDGGVINSEPLNFKLHGEDFACKPNLQGKALLDMASMSSSADPVVLAQGISLFFSKALQEESYARFQSLLDSDKIVTVESLAEIAGWLVQEYSNRPNQGPEQSASGQ
jgi:hypothetical protein